MEPHQAKPVLSALDCALIETALQYAPAGAIMRTGAERGMTTLGTGARLEQLHQRFKGLREDLEHGADRNRR